MERGLIGRKRDGGGGGGRGLSRGRLQRLDGRKKEKRESGVRRRTYGPERVSRSRQGESAERKLTSCAGRGSREVRRGLLPSRRERKDEYLSEKL